MNDREKLIRILHIPVPLGTWEESVADAIIEAGFGDVAEKDKRIAELTEYCVHEKECILSQWREGRPTENGGYESLFGYGTKEKWYKREEQPKCTCGLSDLIGEGKDGGG